MKRGSTTKLETGQLLALERNMITKRFCLQLLRDRCMGCDVCSLACPQEAIELRPGAVENGRLTQGPTIDIDSAHCNFCGECVVLCPVNALQLTVNGQPEVPVIEYETFPELIKEVSVNGDRLRPDSLAACQDSCPTEVISIRTERESGGQVTSVLSVEVDESNCIYCQQCEVACPGVFRVTKPWLGRVLLEVGLCPDGCQACADICPTDALTMQEGQLTLDERFCLYCDACQLICPAEGAVRVERSRILHTPVKSAAWTSALEKLISVEAAAQEFDLKSQGKRRSVLGHLPATGSGDEA